MIKSTKNKSILSNLRKGIDSGFNTIQIGLTGSIGMGKSTVSRQLIRLGFPVFDADQEVHKLYSKNGDAVDSIRAMFPHVIDDDAVNRSKLMSHIVQYPSSLREIEKIVHPLVIRNRRSFFEKSNSEGCFLVVYDIPLLFENRAAYEVDYIIVVTADEETQRRRVLSRPGMTVEKFESILSKQVPDRVKREEADFIIHTHYEGYCEGRAQLAQILESIIEDHPERWLAWKRRSGASALPIVPVAPTAVHPVREQYDVFLFDLDDTLVPMMPQISRALHSLQQFASTAMPSTAQDMAVRLREEMDAVRSEAPLIAHDFTELRHRALHRLASQHGEEAAVAEAVQVFLAHRSHVWPRLYPDVLPCFAWLRSIGVKIGIVTNGSADLIEHNSESDFSTSLSLYLQASDVGCAKPSPVPYLVSSQLLNVPAARILFVGDSYDADVLGARAAGVKAALLVRNDLKHNAAEAEDLKRRYPEADLVIANLNPTEFEAALLAQS